MNKLFILKIKELNIRLLNFILQFMRLGKGLYISILLIFILINKQFNLFR